MATDQSSDLRIRNSKYDTVQLLDDWYLAAQATVEAALRSGEGQHLIFLGSNGSQFRKRPLIHINMASCASGGSAALSDDGFHTMKSSSLHSCGTRFYLNLGALAIGLDENYSDHALTQRQDS